MATTKYIHELTAGTSFKWMNRHFVLSDNRVVDNDGKSTDDITNGFVMTQEINGVGTQHTWLGQPDKFHADVNQTCWSGSSSNVIW